MTNGFDNKQNLVRHLCKFIGETVIIFTASGGISGCGFTGVILSVNCDFVRLVTQQGTAPTCPLSDSCCGDFDNNDTGGNNNCGHHHKKRPFVGSVCDIPVDSIVAFCHNAV